MASKYAYANLECKIRIDARMERVDYGVPGSPTWFEPRDMVVDRVVEIEGLGFRMADLPVRLRKLIEEMAMEDADDSIGWEQ